MPTNVDYTVPQLFTQATLNLLQEHGPHVLTFVVRVKHATHTKQDLAGFSTGPTPKSELRGCCGELLIGLHEGAIAFPDSKTRLKHSQIERIRSDSGTNTIFEEVLLST